MEIRSVAPHDAGRAGAVRLTIVRAEQPPPRMAYNALGSIGFVEDSPQPVIMMYPQAIADLIAETSLQGRREPEWPVLFRELVLGRVFGRALAHEIGHFLLRSREHSIAGLMRANQSGFDLVSVDRHTFALLPGEVTRLASSVDATSSSR